MRTSTQPGSNWGAGTSATEISPVLRLLQNLLHAVAACCDWIVSSANFRAPPSRNIRIHNSSVRNCQICIDQSCVPLPLLVHQSAQFFGLKKPAVANLRCREQIVHHFLQIVRQPIVYRSGESRLRLPQHFAGRTSLHRLAKNVLGRRPQQTLAASYGAEHSMPQTPPARDQGTERAPPPTKPCSSCRYR